MLKLSLIHPFYNHNYALPAHIGNWMEWDPQYKQSVEIIIVDDGSPEPLDVSLLKGLDLNIKVFKVKQDILWNVTGARNLGITQASAPWLAMLDFDMSLLNRSLKDFLKLTVDNNKTYWPFLWLPTKNQPHRTRYPHCNSFFINRETMIKCGMYDEDFAGEWGWEDIFIHDFIFPSNGIKREWRQDCLIRWYRGFASGHVEKHPENQSNVNFKRMKEKAWEVINGTYINKDILRFDWEQVL